NTCWWAASCPRKAAWVNSTPNRAATASCHGLDPSVSSSAVAPAKPAARITPRARYQPYLRSISPLFLIRRDRTRKSRCGLGLFRTGGGGEAVVVMARTYGPGVLRGVTHRSHSHPLPQ